MTNELPIEKKKTKLLIYKLIIDIILFEYLFQIFHLRQPQVNYDTFSKTIYLFLNIFFN